jgi:hypothetical protein
MLVYVGVDVVALVKRGLSIFKFYALYKIMILDMLNRDIHAVIVRYSTFCLRMIVKRFI